MNPEKDNQKVKDLVSFIMEECEKRDLSMEEAKHVPFMLGSKISERISEMKKTVKFTVGEGGYSDEPREQSKL